MVEEQFQALALSVTELTESSEDKSYLKKFFEYFKPGSIYQDGICL